MSSENESFSKLEYSQEKFSCLYTKLLVTFENWYMLHHPINFRVAFLSFTAKNYKYLTNDKVMIYPVNYTLSYINQGDKIQLGSFPWP